MIDRQPTILQSIFALIASVAVGLFAYAVWANEPPCETVFRRQLITVLCV
jgi:hypothetical protein